MNLNPPPKEPILSNLGRSGVASLVLSAFTWLNIPLSDDAKTWVVFGIVVVCHAVGAWRARSKTFSPATVQEIISGAAYEAEKATETHSAYNQDTSNQVPGSRTLITPPK